MTRGAAVQASTEGSPRGPPRLLCYWSHPVSLTLEAQPGGREACRGTRHPSPTSQPRAPRSPLHTPRDGGLTCT